MPQVSTDTESPAGTIHIACLCAAWCRLCDEYRAVFDQVVGDWAGGRSVRRHWVDIEDEADLLGELDIETFPTLVVTDRHGALRFAGAITPQPEALQRLLRSVLDESSTEDGASTKVPGGNLQTEALAARLRLRS